MFNKTLLISTAIATGLMASSAFALQSDFDQINKMVCGRKQLNDNISVLFLQQADKATLRLTSSSKPCYTLELTAKRNKILYFSDQPHRLAGMIDNQEFIRVWQKNNIRPNVMLQGFYKSSHHEKEFTHPFVVNDIQYNAKKHSFVLNACVIGKKKMPTNLTLRDVTLFIDNVHGFPP